MVGTLAILYLKIAGSIPAENDAWSFYATETIIPVVSGHDVRMFRFSGRLCLGMSNLRSQIIKRVCGRESYFCAVKRS